MRLCCCSHAFVQPPLKFFLASSLLPIRFYYVGESGDLEIRCELIRCHASAQCATVVRVFVSRTWILVSFGRATPAGPERRRCRRRIGRRSDPRRRLFDGAVAFGRPRPSASGNQLVLTRKRNPTRRGRQAGAWLALCSHPIHAPSTSRFDMTRPW
jgi:hypothetical protein